MLENSEVGWINPFCNYRAEVDVHTINNRHLGSSTLTLCDSKKESLEARVGIEPTHKGFADLSLTTWVPRLDVTTKLHPAAACPAREARRQ